MIYQDTKGPRFIIRVGGVPRHCRNFKSLHIPSDDDSLTKFNIHKLNTSIHTLQTMNIKTLAYWL